MKTTPTTVEIDSIKQQLEAGETLTLRTRLILYEAIQQADSPKWIFDALLKDKSDLALIGQEATVLDLQHLKKRHGISDAVFATTRSKAILAHELERGNWAVVSNPSIDEELARLAPPRLQVELQPLSDDMRLSLIEHPDAAVRLRAASLFEVSWLERLNDDVNVLVAVTAAWRSKSPTFLQHANPLVRAAARRDGLRTCQPERFWALQVSCGQPKVTVHEAGFTLELNDVKGETIASLNCFRDHIDAEIYRLETRAREVTPEELNDEHEVQRMINRSPAQLDLKVREMLLRCGTITVRATSEWSSDETHLESITYGLENGEMLDQHEFAERAARLHLGIIHIIVDRQENLWLQLSNGEVVVYDVLTDTLERSIYTGY
jgi:hypothetical protein